MEPTGHILSDFDTALAELKEKIVLMGGLAQNSVEKAVRALLVRDVDLCDEVIANDEQVDAYEMEIDQMVVEIMAKYRPFASDLRFTVASMKMANNLERISDHGVSIAKRAKKLLRYQEMEEVNLLEPVCKAALKMHHDAIEAYVDGNLELALQVVNSDARVNELHKAATKKIANRLEDASEKSKSYMNLILMLRGLERVGDHAQNMAEDVVFCKSATDIRHGGEQPTVE